MYSYLGMGIAVITGMMFWPDWEPSVDTLLLAITILSILFVFIRSQRVSLLCLLTVAFLMGALRISVIDRPDLPEEGHLIGRIQRSSGTMGIIDSNQGRMALSFYPQSPPKGAVVAVWYQSRPEQVSWPGGVDHQRRAKRERTVARKAKDWVILKGEERVPKPENFVEMRHGSILWAFASGQRQDIEKETVTLMRKMGTSHFLAISGMHVGLVSGLGYLMLRGLLSPLILMGWERLAVVVPLLGAMGAAAMYGDLVGWPASATRAVVMIVVACGGKMLNWDISPWNLLGIAILLILFREPAAIHDLGFQMSFSAVAGILWIAPTFHSLFDSHQRPVLHRWTSSIGVTIGAMLGTLPLCGWMFQTLPLMAPLSNLLTAPLMGMTAVPCALFAYATTGWLSDLFLCIGDAAVELSLTMLILFETEPIVVAFSPLDSIVATGVLICIRYTSWSVVLLLPLYVNLNSLSHRLEVQFLQMGQGDAAWVRWPNGENWLVDAGPFSFELVPYLRREGVREIEWVVLSHPHQDHFGALLSVVDNMNVKRFLTLRPPKKEEKQYQQLWERLKERGVEVVLSAHFQADNATLWHPLRGWSNSTRRTNEDSLVMEITFGQHRFLFAGDIERQAERHLLGKIGDIDVLKVPHHGSKSSSSADWLAELQPEVAVISCGANNSFGHPHSQTLFALRDTHSFRTDTDGLVIVSSDGHHLEVKSRQNQYRRALKVDKPLLLR